MKTAPDKIYLPIIEEEGKRLLCTNWWENDTSSRNAYVNETIPYIRKDAILEWIEGKMTIEEETEGYIGGYDAALKEVIDKIGSL